MGSRSAQEVRKKSDHKKPQESYIAMISSAILSTPDKRMTLSEINEYLMKNYECFQGEYQGWKNSVRHNLSFNKCFVKILRKPSRNWGKNNYWGVEETSLKDYLREDGKFRRRRRKKQCKQSTKKSSLALNRDMTNYDCLHKMRSRVFSGQERATPGQRQYNSEYSRWTSGNAFSIDNILQRKQQLFNNQPLSCSARGWAQLKNTSRYLLFSCFGLHSFDILKF